MNVNLKGVSKGTDFYLAHNGNIPQIKHDTQRIINFRKK